MKVLITGIAGTHGQLLAHRLSTTHDVCGVDLRPWRGRPPGVRIHRVDIRKRRFEEVIRSERPDVVAHLGFTRHFRHAERLRHDNNVRGTRILLDHCVKYEVKQLLVLSSSYVYGAFAENPYDIDEDSPVSGSRSYPEIRDLVEVDSVACSFLWQHPEIRTSVLRPVGVLGPNATSMMSAYLQLPRVPTVAGFDPVMQFIAPDDLCRALSMAIEGGLRGVYNVVGSGQVPVHTAIRETGAIAWPLPGPLARVVFARLFDWGVWDYPAGVLDFLRYPLCINGRRFSADTGYRPLVSLREIFASMREPA